MFEPQALYHGMFLHGCNMHDFPFMTGNLLHAEVVSTETDPVNDHQVQRTVHIALIT